MPKITQKDFLSINPETGIHALLIEGSNPSLLTIDWVEKNGYRWLSVPDVYQRAGLEGIVKIREDQLRWEKDITHERRDYNFLRAEVYTLFNSFFLSRQTRTMEEINSLSNEEFFKMEWLNFYVAHNPKIDASKVVQNGNDASLVVSKELQCYFDMKDMGKIMKFDGAPWEGVCWLEGDLTKNPYSQEQLFGQAVNNYARRVAEMGFRRSILFSCLPSMELRARPVDFWIPLKEEFSFSDHPFWYQVPPEDTNLTRVDKIYVFPIMNNSVYSVHS
jgi:hypothetical protein